MDRMKLTELYEKFMAAVDVLATSPARSRSDSKGPTGVSLTLNQRISMTSRCKPHLNKFALGTLVARFAPLLAVEESPRLLAKNFPRKEDRRVSMTLADFLTAAYKLANDKARELGWIA